MSAAARRERDERLMRVALDACRRGVDDGQSPFGACIARGDAVLAASHNEVWRTLDPTAHAEVVAIREACRKLGALALEGATIYSTTEPCPMCFGAIHWSRIDRIVFGAAIGDAAAFGFGELAVSNRVLAAAPGARVEVEGGCLRPEALAEFERWRAHGGRAY